MAELTTTRRSVVATTGTLAVAALAGCSGSTGDGNDGGGSDGDASGGGGDAATAAPETAGDGGTGDATTAPSGGESGGDAATFGGWMEDVGNYDGVVDETGSDRVTVAVGADGNGGAFAFDPAAVRVSSGTTVVWEWTGKGGQHDVAAEGGSFDSDLSGEEGYTFEHAFSESGTYEYACTPHRSLGMKGVVVVE